MEKTKNVDQRIQEFLRIHRQLLSRQGAIIATWRERLGRRWGPYFRLVCRLNDRRQRSIYLGPSGPLVEEIRVKLAELQAPLKTHRYLSRVRKQLSEELAKVRRELGEQVAKLGLVRHGSEVRGWSHLQRHKETDSC